MEHRWGNRVPLNALVRLATVQGEHLARLCNLSLSGAFLETRQPLPHLTQLTVELTISPEEAARKASIGAHVVRTTADGIGIEWSELAPPPVTLILSRTFDSAESARDDAQASAGTGSTQTA